MKRDRLVRDPVYDYISLPAELANVVDDVLFQRLRRIAQTSLTSTVYPAATGSRFEHALGAMHLAALAWTSAWENAVGDAQDAFVEAAHAEFGGSPAGARAFGARFRLVVGAVGLLHDVGHPPFSHVLEETYQHMIASHLRSEPELLEEWRTYGGPLHEFAGVLLTRRLAGRLPASLTGMVTRVYEADPDDGSWAGAAHSIVAGEIDVDRLDYLIRDAQKAGTEFGAIDRQRLIDALELHHDGHRFRIAPGVRGRSAVETLLTQRSQSYKWITFHHRVVGSNLALARATDQLRSLIDADDKARVDDHNEPLSHWFRGHVPNLNYLAPTLDDVSSALTTAEPADNQLPLGDNLQADWLRAVVDGLRASVDDGALLEWLRRSSLLARALLSRAHLTEAVRLRLDEFVTYADAALWRAKNFMPTWKTVEEFAGAAKEMELPLKSAVSDAFDQLLDGSGGGSALRDSLEDQRTHLLNHLDLDIVAGTNRVVGLVARTSDQLELLRFALQAQRDEVLGLSGFWDVAFTSFKPVRMSGNLTVLYRGDSPQSLIEHSPLIQSLDDIERHRPKLLAFFFLRARIVYGNFERDLVREARAGLTGDFIAVFPKFVRDNLAGGLLDNN